MTKKKIYKPKSKNVSLLSVYLGMTKNTDRNVSKNETNKPTSSNNKKSRFY
jgi:hypothetical protein